MSILEAHDNNLEPVHTIVPEHFQEPKYKGTAISNRSSHSTYGEHGVLGLDKEIKHAMASGNTFAHKAANKYSNEKFGHDYNFHPEQNSPSSLAKQYAIAKTFDIAHKDNHAYNTAVYNDYKEHHPEFTHGTNDYHGLVEKSYQAVAKETNDQFNHIPAKLQFHNGDMNYHNSNELLRDVHGHNNLTVFKGGDRHEFLNEVDPKHGINSNEAFRAVHDFYGHSLHGNQFGAKGEETAWAAHSKMYSPLAKLAMTSETRGQNSFVNYSGVNTKTQQSIENHRRLRKAALNSGNIPLAQTHEHLAREAGNDWKYAEQKSIILPKEMNRMDYNGEVPHSIAHLLVDKEAKTNPVYDTKSDKHNLVELARHHNTVSHNATKDAGKFNKENATSDLHKLIAVHGYKSLDKNPY